MNKVIELKQKEINLISGGTTASAVGGVIGTIVAGWLGARSGSFACNNVFMSKILGKPGVIILSFGGTFIGAVLGNLAGRTAGTAVDHSITGAKNIYNDCVEVLNITTNIWHTIRKK